MRSLWPVLFLVIGVFSFLALNLWSPKVATAATSNSINFQAKLMTAAGAIAADGTYNIEFNIYNVVSGGSTLWTEDYLNNAAQGVTVKNGYVTVNLGSITAFPSTINWDQNLWLGMTVRGTGSCTFGTCSPTDAEMSPRLPLTAVPYAFKAGQLAQYNAGTTFTSTLSIVQPTGGNQIFQIPDQTAAGTYSLLTNMSGVQLQASTPGTAQGTSSTGNFNVGGTGIANIFNATTALQTAGVTRVDSSGNLTNIGNIAGSGTIHLSGTTGSSYIMSSLGLGTISPQSGSALTVANATWLSSVDSTGSGYINMFQVNTNNQIQLGAALNIDGGIVLPTDGGQMTFSDLPVDSTPTSGTKESYTFRVGSTNALTIYGESDGAGGIQNIRTAIGSSIAPSYPLDVTGDINSSTGLRVAGTTVCTVTGCTATSGSGSYVQLQATTPGTAQGSSSTGNFNIGGTGIANVFQAPTFDAVSGALGIGTSNATAVNIQPAGTTTATITIGAATLATGTITVGSSTGAQSILIANGTGASTVSIANNVATATGNTVNIAGGATATGLTDTVNIATGNTVGTGAKAVHIADGTPAGTNAVTIGSIANASTLLLQGGTGTGASAGLKLNTAAAGDILIGNTAQTGAIVLGQSTATNTVQIANGSGATTLSLANATVSGVTLSIAGAANTSANSISIANGLTAANTTVSILSGVGTAGAGTLLLGNNTRVTTIGLGNINPAVARTISIGNSTATANTVIDTINIATNPTTVAGGNTVHIADGALTSVGTNLVTIGSTVNASTLLLQGGTGTGASAGLKLNTAAAGDILIGNTAQTGAIVLGQSTATNTVQIANGSGATTLSLANATVSGVTLSIAGAANTSANSISIANGLTAANTTVSILSGVGTAGAGTLLLGNNTRVTTIGLGNINPAVARTISIGNSTATANTVIDTINIATNPTTVAGGNTVHIADGVPTGSGTNLVTIGGSGALNGSAAGTTVKLQGGATGFVVSNFGAYVQSYTNSASAFQVLDAIGAPVLVVDTTTANLISNPGFETGITGWSGSGTGASVAQNLTLTKVYLGVSSLKVTTATSGTTTATVTGFTSTLSAGTYTFSFFAMGDNAVTLGSTVTFTGGAGTCTLNSTAIVTTGFNRYWCTVTTTGTTTGISFTTATNSAVLYLDAVQLNSNGSLVPYHVGGIQLRGVITSPVAIQTTSDSTTAFQIQNAAGTSNLFVADTLNSQIIIGSSGNTLTLSPTTGFTAAGTARHPKSIMLPAEYAGAVLDAAADGSCSAANAGTVTAGLDNTHHMNYYDWNSTSGTTQCYDVVVQVPIPSDWSAWATSNQFNVQFYEDNTTNTSVAVQVLDNTGTADTNYNYFAPSTPSVNTWTNAATNGSFASSNYSAGSYMTIKIRMNAKSSSNLRLGNITLNYQSSF